MRLNTQIGKIYALLSANRSKRVSVLQLQRVTNSMCVSTQVSNLRRGYNLTIENKEIRQKNGLIYSYYRIVRGTVKPAKKR